MIDALVIIAYFLIVLFVGLRSGRKIKTITQYSIGDRNFSTTTLVATLTATLIGGGATFGLAEKTIKFGLIFPLAYCGICVSRYLEAVIIPKKMKPFFGMISAGDIMQKLYGKYAKILTGVATLTTSIFILGAHITAMGFLLESLLRIPLNISLIIGSLSVIIYSGYGGISAVSLTDVAQLVFMLVAIPAVCVLGLIDVGGFSKIVASVPIAHLDLRYLKMNTIFDHGAIWLSYALPALFPVVIQRMLMSKNEKQIKYSMLLNGFLSAAFFFLVAIIGLVVMTKAPETDPKLAFPFLIKEMLPVGFRGLAIAGLLAVIMSTVDSFLNLIGITITHDILHPIIGEKLTEEKQLMLARITGCLAGLIGLVSALYFNGILENVFASMNLWIPYIFPALFLGILRPSYSPSSFYAGILAAFVTSMTLKAFAILPGFAETLLAALSNGLVLSLKMKKPKVESIDIKTTTPIAPVNYVSIVTNNTYKIYEYIKKQYINLTNENIHICEIFSVFVLFFSTLPILASSGMGNRLSAISLALNAIIAAVAVLIIFNDLWAYRVKKLQFFLWPSLVITALVIHPVFVILSFKITPLLMASIFLGWLILYLFSNEASSITFMIIGSVAAWGLHAVFSDHYFEPSGIAQTVEVIVKALALAYFFVIQRRGMHQKIKDYDSLSGTMAHEIGHSITAMNLAARRLKNTLPTLKDRENAILAKSGVEALENLAERLEHDADHTNNAIQIILTKFGINAVKTKTRPFPISSAIHEALQSGIIQNLTARIEIEVSPDDFTINAEQGSMVHVFINLIKNSAEALGGVANPKITVNINSQTGSIELIDNGCGIPKGTLTKIFEENFTTKNKGKGKGLYFCKLVIELFGGSIACDSEASRTVFAIKLPITGENNHDSSYDEENISAFYRR